MNFVNGTKRTIVFGGNGKVSTSFVNPSDYVEVDTSSYDEDVIRALKRGNADLTIIEETKKIGKPAAKKTTKKTTSVATVVEEIEGAPVDE